MKPDPSPFARPDVLDLKNRFNYHAPPTSMPQIGEAHEAVRNKLFAVACEVVALVPQGRELALALTNLEQAMMWANAGIARNHVAFAAPSGTDQETPSG